jgi:hypothetical protein
VVRTKSVSEVGWVLTFVIVRIPRKVERQWVLRHEKDGLDETGISVFLKLQYELQHYEKTAEELLLFVMNFQKRGGQPMQAELWVRERRLDGIVELILIRAHVESL